MAKFEVEFEVQALKLKIKGEREDAALISRAIGEQMAGLIQPAGVLIDGELAINSPIQPPSAPAVIKKRGKRPRGTQSNNEAQPATAIDFSHDPQKFGYPLQTWKTAEKAMWLLFTLKETTAQDEASGRTLTDTFNKHFKQCGTITVSNVNRDLGRLKASEKPSPLGEDTTKSPSNWFLTDEGRKRAQALVAAALGEGK